ncbi:predicted protein [Streptomyces iranensis]|uniref:Uncharacterized protein n=1 Tax=Streptomyces iranensis TaxID=576784 RepID=A0A060ZMT9_9ACTN|nr:predicted protein [Streptomyces iranensis]
MTDTEANELFVVVISWSQSC